MRINIHFETNMIVLWGTRIAQSVRRFSLKLVAYLCRMCSSCTSDKYLPSCMNGAVTVADWLRTLIFSALNHSSSHRCGFEPSSCDMLDKPKSACLWSGGFSWVSPVFAPPYD